MFHNNHPLVTTDLSRLTWKDFDHVKNIIDAYNLEELFAHFRFTRKSRVTFSIGVDCSQNLGSDCHPIAWAKSLYEYVYNTPHTLSYSADIQIDAFVQELAPFMSSSNNHPDGAVLRKLREWHLPIFMLEMHSSPYRNSVSHTAANVLDQFRLLRCFNDNIKECIGFTFPKYPTDKSANKSCVTKVTISFKEYMFVIKLTPLKTADVKKEIITALLSAIKFEATPDPLFCFLCYHHRK